MTLKPHSHHLILGGARSGKSAYAESLAKPYNKVAYIATAQALDTEMTQRIERHQAERPSHYMVFEEAFALTERLSGMVEDYECVIVDCVTLWLSNLLCNGWDIQKETTNLLSILPDLKGNIIFVSNEVGLGIVPDNPLARQFRDAQGWLNQKLAMVCHHVSFMVAGLEMRMK